MNKQLLIAVDDSITSSHALEYAAFLFSDQQVVSFHLLHCLSSGAEILPKPDNEDDTLIPGKTFGKREEKALQCLQKARRKLVGLGIDDARITSSCQNHTNIAQAIIHYGQKHLVDAIIVARRGVGVVGEMLLGSVSAELFQQCRSVPLWIIDGPIQSDRILVPVDGTPSSLMAVDHLGHIFSKRNDIQFFFFHARGFLSPPPVCKPENFYDKWGKDWCDSHLSGNGCMFTGPTELLTAAGIPPECISTLPMPTAIEESSAIISSARKNNCGTIVIGRRPESEVTGFFGGVARRTILQTEDLSLWVIG